MQGERRPPCKLVLVGVCVVLLILLRNIYLYIVSMSSVGSATVRSQKP